MVWKSNYQHKQAFSKKPPRPMSDKYLHDELDAITSVIVRMLESVCFTVGCDKRVGLECGHLFERRHKHTRYDTTPDGNCHAQCPLHNQEHERNPSLYEASYIQRFGEAKFEALRARARSNQKLTYSDLLELLEQKQQQLAELKSKAA